jgi:hypothetical protein
VLDRDLSGRHSGSLLARFLFLPLHVVRWPAWFHSYSRVFTFEQWILGLSVPQRRKSKGVRFGERGGCRTGSLRPTNDSEMFILNDLLQRPQNVNAPLPAENTPLSWSLMAIICDYRSFNNKIFHAVMFALSLQALKQLTFRRSVWILAFMFIFRRRITPCTFNAQLRHMTYKIIVILQFQLSDLVLIRAVFGKMR